MDDYKFWVRQKKQTEDNEQWPTYPKDLYTHILIYINTLTETQSNKYYLVR